jgi:hypothetical protein
MSEFFLPPGVRFDSNPNNMFSKSAQRFVLDHSKKTFIYPEEICSNFTLQEDELNVFLLKGCDDLKKIEKSKEEIEKDKDVRLQSGFEATDPRNLLR